ncbi:S-adenosyl-L-methionine-dependent methyltransferase [Colletotrichum phormii]|uniref:S-adenosyl-L-methionine-dependent methyltransferase n=1 Tax=Colletotrichum phormii TaxID=359342 RepID=A0AAI9ZSV7_9PEZI|nr:S-adenosyl-L-methionine-dependent methyltransferase [Colletotrichum phormii]KAK1637579.1 S-adenosyl-L-methionine-dependent methyltransferase [Colletotrichum phormii]
MTESTTRQTELLSHAQLVDSSLPKRASGNTIPGGSTRNFHDEIVTLEPDDADAAGDASAIDERISNYTVSLSSSVVDYPMEYGRRYHAFRPEAYFAPNDDAGTERLDMCHALMVKAIGSKLYLAPRDKSKMRIILDIGTGTGLWAVEIGDIFTDAEVVGNDLSAIQPSWAPPNVRFEVDDVESPWVEQKYDYIMCRYMAGSILDWPKLVKNIYGHLNPGGWAEFQEMICEYYSDDGSYTVKHATWGWNKTLVRTLESIDRDPNPVPKVEGWVVDAGFRSIFHQRFKTPIGPWPKDPHYKEVGLLNLAQNLEGLEAFSMRLMCGVLGRTREQALAQIQEVRKELKSGVFHALFDLHVVYGQKPSDEEEQA